MSLDALKKTRHLHHPARPAVPQPAKKPSPTVAAPQDTFESKKTETPKRAAAPVDRFEPCSQVAPKANVDEVNRQLADGKSDFDRTKGVVDANNKKLAQHLARLGPALSPEQKKAYIEQFRKDHAADDAAYEAATTKLADAVKQASAQPNLPPQTTLLALSSAKALAETPEGAQAAKDFAVAVAKQLEANPGYFTGGLNNVSQTDAVRELNEIVSTAVPNLYSSALRDAGGDPKAAGDALAAQLEGIERLRVFSSSAEPIQKGIEALRNGDFEALKTLDQGNRFGRAFQIAGVALGIAKLGSGADLSASDYLQTLVSTTKDGAELVATGMKALATSARIGENLAATLSSGAGFLERITPGLGVAANALQTYVDGAKLLSGDGNVGDAVAVIGDAMATVGGVLSCTGVGEVAAVPLQIVGTVISKTGGVISDGINREALVEEERQLLEKIGLGDSAGNIARADPDALKVLGDAMAPDEVRALLDRNPGAFTSEYAAREYLAIRNRTVGYPAAHG